MTRRLLSLLLLALAVACSEDAPPPASARTPAGAKPPGAPAAAAAAPAPAAEKALAEQGRQYYLSSCIACHNSDPTLDGALGPPVAGSSAELLEARVMRAEYPEGYTPKRDTRVMVAMPFLEKQLPALAAYLAPKDEG